MPIHNGKIAIVGAGSVGATIAYACLIRGIGQPVVLYDVNKSKVTAEVLDLNHGLQFTRSVTVEGSNDPAVCADAAIVVITAGAKQKAGQSRMDLAEANAGICKTMLPQLIKVAPDAVYLMVTNPVDVITYIAQKISGLPTARVLGSGTVLDSSRFRWLIASRLKLAVRNVHAYIAGEHGDSEIPLWSSATVGNVPIDQWNVKGHGSLNADDRQDIFNNVRTAAAQIIQGKGATNYAIGLATADILEALFSATPRILPISSRLTDYQGISDVCLSVPTILNRHGVEQPLPVPMDAIEIAGLRRSADTIRQAIRDLNF